MTAPEAQDRKRFDSLPPREREEYEFEVEFLAPVVEARPHYLEALHPLAHAYTALGRYAEGLAVDERICALSPQDPVAHYNRACSEALTGRIDAAFATLEEARRLGYCDWQHMAADPDLAPLRPDPRFAAFVRADHR